MAIDLNISINFIIAAITFFIISLIISTLLTKKLIRILPKMGLIDQPGGRHIHTHATPKGGGIGFIIATLFCIIIISLLFCPNDGSATFILCPKSTFQFCIASIAIALIGFFDDKYNISAKLKLLAQIGVASYCWSIGYQFDSFFGIQFPIIVSYCVTVFWIISFINAFNLIDGLDGLAAGLSLISAGTLSIFFLINGNMPAALFMIIIMGALLGFLKYNFYPAKLFMGDTGSMFLGLTFAITGLISANKTATLTSLLIPVLAAGVPFFDVTLAIWRRLSKRWLMKLQGVKGDSKVMGADKEHLHHRIMNKAGTQRKTVLTIYAIACMFAILALLLIFIRDKSEGVTYLLILSVVFAIVRATAYIEFHNSTMAIFHGLKKPSRSMLIQILHPLFDLVVLFTVYYGIHFIFKSALPGHECETLSCHKAVYTHALAPIGFLLLFRIYRILWQRASGYEYMLLVRTLTFGFLASTLFSALYGLIEPNLFLIKEFSFASISLLIILGERMLLRYIKTLMYHSSIKRTGHLDTAEEILVYGAGRHFHYYIDSLLHRQENSQRHIGAVIDDNILIQGMHISGFRIKGTIHDIETLYKTNKFSKIIVTANLSQVHFDLLHDIANKLSIRIIKWKVSEEEIML